MSCSRLKLSGGWVKRLPKLVEQQLAGQVGAFATQASDAAVALEV